MLLTSMVLTACHQKDLVWPGEVTGVLNISYIWDDSETSSPDGMALYFYPTDVGGRIWRFDIAGHDGGPVEIPYGSYSLLTFNNDVGRIRYEDTGTMSTFKVVTVADGNVVAPISPIFRSVVGEIVFTPEGVTYLSPDGSVIRSSAPVVYSQPGRITTRYNIIINSISSLDHVSSVRVKLNGLSDGIMLRSGESVGREISVTPPLAMDRDAGRLSASFDSFGYSRHAEKVTLEVNVTTVRRSVFATEIDVTPQVVNSVDPLNVYIIINTLDIPDEGGDAGDGVEMNVGVDGWTQIIIDYNTENIH